MQTIIFSKCCPFTSSSMRAGNCGASDDAAEGLRVLVTSQRADLQNQLML